MNNLISLFKSEQGEEKYMAAYDAMMAYWPLSYESNNISGSLRLHTPGREWSKRCPGFGTFAWREGQPHHVVGEHNRSQSGIRAVKECLYVVARRGLDLKLYPETKMYTNSSAIARMAAGIKIRLLFRFNKSVMRSSIHALGDPREIKPSLYDLLNTGKEPGIAMPVMSSFEHDIEQFAGGK
jgi:hypothetical protein